MSFDFEQFAHGLNDEDRGVLFAATPFLTALVARADGRYSFREKIARWKSFRQARTDLDESFVSPQAVSDVEAHLKRIAHELEDLESDQVEERIRAELRRIRKVLKRMSSDLRSKFEQFLIEACLGVAKSSGKFLWLGEHLSAGEKEVLRLIVRELKLQIDDGELRRALEMT